jgi:hypothetical protein
MFRRKPIKVASPAKPEATEPDVRQGEATDINPKPTSAGKTEATMVDCPQGHVGCYRLCPDGKRRCRECKRLRQLARRHGMTEAT